MTVAIAADLVRWFQLLCMDSHWVNTRPKAMRWGILHAPGRLVTKVGTRSCASSTVARHRRAARCLPAHRTHHLTNSSTPPEGTSLTTRAPLEIRGMPTLGHLPFFRHLQRYAV